MLVGGFRCLAGFRAVRSFDCFRGCFVNSGGWCNSFVLWFCYWLHLFGWCGILLGCCFDVCRMVLNVLVIWYFVVMV